MFYKLTKLLNCLLRDNLKVIFQFVLISIIVFTFFSQDFVDASNIQNNDSSIEVTSENLSMISPESDYSSLDTPLFTLFREEGFFKRIIRNIREIFTLEDSSFISKVSAEIITPEDESISDIEINSLGKDSVEVKVDDDVFKKPGTYTIKLSYGDEVVEQSFVWGVLAINMNKSMYIPEEQVYLQMAVLKEDGHTICDANLSLEITLPSKETQNILVRESGQCNGNNVTTVPDYISYYAVEEIGEYDVKLVNNDNGHYVKDSFKVVEDRDFDIERSGPTRIYPLAEYEMRVRVTPKQAFNGTLTESVPEGFEITAINSDGWINPIGDIQWDVDLDALESIDLVYIFDAPDNSPYLYKAGTLKVLKSDTLLFEELRQWQIAADPPTFRSMEYWITTGDFTGTTYDLTLAYDLADNYFILVRGSKDVDENVTTYPDNDFIRVIELPGGKGDLPTSGASNVITLSRHVADYNWEGVITVVECLGNCDTSGFTLLDVSAITMGNSVTSGTDTSSTAWSDINQVALFGSIHGGGSEFDVDATNYDYGNAGEARLYPSSTNTINWARDSSQSRLQVTTTTFVVEWGSEWEVHRVNIAATIATADGCNATSEYNTASLGSTVNRANTWVWGTGHSNQAGIGDNMESTVIALGNGVATNSTESTVGWCGEYASTRDMDIYTMTHSGLSVAYYFKADGDTALVDVTVPIATAPVGQRFAWVTNSCNGSGTAHPRDRFSARYTADTAITLSRGRSGQAFPAWVQGIDFTGVTYVVNAPFIRQNNYRWRDDTVALNTTGGWTAAEDLDQNAVFAGVINRLRFKVVNTGLQTQSAASTYELQWGNLSGNSICDTITTWAGIGDASDEFEMVDSTYITSDGQSTTTGLLSNVDGYTWVNGEGRDVADTTGSIGPLGSNEYTEVEYSFQPTTQATIGNTYCFRLYDTNASSPLDFYPFYPKGLFSTPYDYTILNTNGGPTYRVLFNGDIVESIQNNATSGNPYGYLSTIIPNNYGQSAEYTASQETLFTNALDVNSGITTRKIVSFWTIIDTFGSGTGSTARNIWEEGGSTNWWGAYTANGDSIYIVIGEGNTQKGYCYKSGLSTNTLYHVVMQWEGSTDTMELWIDGTLACTTSTSTGTQLPAHTGDWEIGGNADSKDHTSTVIGLLFDGKIGDYSYWAEPSRFLTQSEIEDIYEAGAGTGGVTFSGNIFTDEGSTGLDCSTSRTVNLLVNGAGTYTTECDNSSGNGYWSIPSVAVDSGDTITVYLSGETEKASTAVVSDGSAKTDIDLYQNRVIIRDDVNGTITNSEIHAGNPSDAGDDLLTTTASTVTVPSSYEMHIYSGDTYAPGGDVTVGKLHIPLGSTYSGGSENLSLSGSGTGTSRPLYIDSGTFTAPTRVSYIGTSNLDIEATSYNDLYATPNSGTQTYYMTSGTFSISGSLSSGGSGVLTIDAETYDPDISCTTFAIGTGQSFSASSIGDLYILGSYIVNGSFISNSSTVTLSGSSNVNLSSGCSNVSSCPNQDFYNLVIQKQYFYNTVSLLSTGISVSNTLSINTGTLTQGSYNILSNGSSAVIIGTSGVWSNTSTGDVLLNGTLANSGILLLKANNSCGDINDISVSAVSGTPAWSGTGSFDISDVTISNQDADVDINVYSCTDGGGNTGLWHFYPGCDNGSLITDIVDSVGIPVSSPLFPMDTKPFTFNYQSSSGVLGVSNQKIRVSNTTANSQWSLSLAATSGPTAFWDGSPEDYDYNDPTSNAGDGTDFDNIGGQLSVNPSLMTITPQSGCTQTGLSKGSSSSFDEENTINSITVLTSGSSSEVGCYWDLTSSDLSQTIPSEQYSGSYSINMTLTIMAY